MDESATDELPECAHEVCPTIAVAKVGRLLVCTEHLIWAAEHLKSSHEDYTVEPAPGAERVLGPPAHISTLRDYRP